MDRMKEKTLMQRMMNRFSIAIIAILILATPVLYYLTTAFYAEDLYDMVEDYGIKNPDIDLSHDVIAGLFIQLFTIVIAMLIAVYTVMKIVPQRLWRPFRDTLSKVSDFNVETGNIPSLPQTDVKEFNQLNRTLTHIMQNSAKSYRVQKEFTENASHELQTPLAIVLGKIDNMIQDPDITEKQAHELQEIYRELHHMSHLSRSLLLLSKIENNQYHIVRRYSIERKLIELIPQLETIAGNINIRTQLDSTLQVACNETLLESLIRNLVINAVRHNVPNGEITVKADNSSLTVENTSCEPELDSSRIFSRFYRTGNVRKGNGLGLAIVKSICDYHHWNIQYRYSEGRHSFTVLFNI
jgi:signal transduction histidine kinase